MWITIAKLYLDLYCGLCDGSPFLLLWLLKCCLYEEERKDQLTTVSARQKGVALLPKEPNISSKVRTRVGGGSV